MEEPADQIGNRLHFVEDVGLVMEHLGLPRMAGRILGWLLICDPPYQSLGAIAGALQASKGSISTMTRLLIDLELVDRISLPGERRDYYQLDTRAWPQVLQARLAMVTEVRELADHGLDLLAAEPEPVTRRLRSVRNMYAWFERELLDLFDRWERTP